MAHDSFATVHHIYTYKLQPNSFSQARSGAEDGEEEQARENWLISLSVSLIGDGKRSFLDTISKCLSLGNSDLMRVCLTTVAWLSSSVASLSVTGTELQLYAFSALISPLKHCLDHGELLEHRILASFSLLNFSNIPGQSIFKFQTCHDHL